MKLLISVLLISGVALAQNSASDDQTKPQTAKARRTKLPAKRAKTLISTPPVANAAATQATVEDNKALAPSPQFDPTNSVKINYAYAGWNKNAVKIDSGSLIMREGATGHLVQIHLSETEPDSSMFSGLYSINFQTVDKLKIEFYVPPQNLLETSEGMKKINNMISSGQLRRNPFILRRTPTGAQTVEIFDTREQAQSALSAYRAEQQIQGLQNAKFPSDGQVATAKLAKELQEKELAARLAAERVRADQLEAQKLAALKAKEAAMNAAEKARRKQEAGQLAAEAMALYTANKFPEAAQKFEQAVNLDPDNRSYYFQYGFSLYRIDSNNKSLTYLNLADGPTVDVAQKYYYIGLNYFKLKEYPNAVTAFDKVIETKNADLEPSAQFYKGVINFEQKNWEPAKTAFQAVLDTSKDPALDKQAETYIESILSEQQYEAERSHKWKLSATVGEIYDSNITLASDSSLSQGSATNVDGYRSLAMAGVQYRPVYDRQNEFAVAFSFLDMYTVDKNFNYTTTLRNTDPMVYNIGTPWTYKGLMFGKGYKLDVTPAYESIWMSVEENTNKEIISSVILNASNLFVMSENLFSNFNIETRRDQNKLNSVTGDDDSTAIKVKLINSNLHFISEDKLKMMTSEGSITLNQAQGKNATYNRYDLAVGYMQPFKWDTTATAKLSYFYLNYPLKSDNRLDNSYSFTGGLSKKLSDTYSAGFTAIYNINNSSSDTYTYKKWSAMLTLSAATDL